MNLNCVILRDFLKFVHHIYINQGALKFKPVKYNPTQTDYRQPLKWPKRVIHIKDELSQFQTFTVLKEQSIFILMEVASIAVGAQTIDSYCISAVELIMI